MFVFLDKNFELPSSNSENKNNSEYYKNGPESSQENIRNSVRNSIMSDKEIERKKFHEENDFFDDFDRYVNFINLFNFYCIF